MAFCACLVYVRTILMRDILYNISDLLKTVTGRCLSERLMFWSIRLWLIWALGGIGPVLLAFLHSIIHYLNSVRSIYSPRCIVFSSLCSLLVWGTLSPQWPLTAALVDNVLLLCLTVIVCVCVCVWKVHVVYHSARIFIKSEVFNYNFIAYMSFK